MDSIKTYLYTYAIVPESIRVIDGDTIDCVVDLGFHVKIHKRIRFSKVDTDELRGGTVETKRRANLAKALVEHLCSAGQVYVTTKMDSEGKYGRMLGDLLVELDEQIIDISDFILSIGLIKGNCDELPFDETVDFVEYIKMQKESSVPED